MSIALLSHFMLTTQTSSWITPECWNCLINILDTYCENEDILLLSDFKAAIPWMYNRVTYTATDAFLPKYRHFVTVMIYDNLSSRKFSNLHGKVVMIVKSLDNIEELWIKFKIVDILVLLLTKDHCDLYTWFPFEPKLCHKPIVLDYIDSCVNGSLLKQTHLFSIKVEKNLKGCPLQVVLCPCDPFAYFDTNNELQGPEINVVRSLLKAINAKYVTYPVVDYYRYYTLHINGAFSGAFELLLNRKVDIAGTCLSTAYSGSETFEFLPSHFLDGLVWLLPPPVPKSRLYGYFGGFHLDVWSAILIAFLSSIVICKFSLPSKALAWGLMWSISRILGVSFQSKYSRDVLNMYSIIFEWCSLIVTTLYKSSLLLNIFFVPTEKYETPSEAVQDGLFTMYRVIYMHMYNHSDHEFWNTIMTPGRGKQVFMFDHNEIIVNRSAIGLITKHVDELRIRKEYPTVPLETLVYEYPIMYANMRHVLFLPPSHPVAPFLAQQMTHFIASGIPDLYLKQYYYKWPKISNRKEIERKPLQACQVMPIFQFLSVGLGVSIVAFCLEVLAGKRGGAEKEILVKKG